jgi:hypothetical protein
MLSNFGLLPAIQYSSGEAINREVQATSTLLPSSIEDSKEIPKVTIDTLSPRLPRSTPASIYFRSICLDCVLYSLQHLYLD